MTVMESRRSLVHRVADEAIDLDDDEHIAGFKSVGQCAKAQPRQHIFHPSALRVDAMQRS
jgi:hypothetical protein